MFTTLCLIFVLSITYLVQAGDVSQGDPCSTAEQRLDLSSHKFLSDCNHQTFCSGSGSTSTNGTCQSRKCRRDEFPFGYAPQQPLPPLCPKGSFCPDEGSGCAPLLTVGQQCQLNRDDQCAPPPDWQALANNQNFNGSLCLQSTCMYANVSLGQACIIDTVTYVDDGPDGQQFSNSISRDNCQSGRLYCDSSVNVCVPTKMLGAACAADQECETFNCGPQGACADPPEMPLHVPLWQYVITSLSVIGAMAATIVTLTLAHKRLRLKRYREIRDYYEEQLSLRRSIAALHAAAAERYYEDEKVNFESEGYRS